MARHSTLCVLLLFVACFVSIDAMIQQFTGKEVLTNGSTTMWWTSMFSLTDTPAGTEEPSVILDLQFQRSHTGFQSGIDLLIFESTLLHLVGHYDANTKSVEYCCTQELLNSHVCSSLGAVILKSDKSEKLVHWKIKFESSDPSSPFVSKFVIPETGIYVLQMTNCDGSGISQVTPFGMVIWRNPYGYLPADAYVKLPFSGVMALFYLLLLIIYGIFLFKYRKIVLSLQYCILALVVWGLLEIAAWYFYRLGLNNSGIYSLPGLLSVVFLVSVKKMVSRLLMLLAAMGLGVTKWTLGSDKKKIALLSGFYMFFSFIHETIVEVEKLEKTPLFSKNTTFMLSVPSALLNTAFYYWIVVHLIRTIQQLTLRKQELKHQLYRRFLGILIIVGVVSGIVMIVEAVLNLTHQIIPWKQQWLLDAFWELFYFALVIAMAILWRPRANNHEIALTQYDAVDMEEMGGKTDFESPASAGDLNQRKKNPGPGVTTTTTTTSTAPTPGNASTKTTVPVAVSIDGKGADESSFLHEFEKELMAIDATEDHISLETTSASNKID